MAVGPGIRPGKLERTVDVTDFGPTIASMLGVELLDTDGTIIPEVSPRVQSESLTVPLANRKRDMNWRFRDLRRAP